MKSFSGGFAAEPAPLMFNAPGRKTALLRHFQERMPSR
jgi:hypothetical protein